MPQFFEWEFNDNTDWKQVIRSYVAPRLFGRVAARPAVVLHQNYPFLHQNAAAGVLTSGTVFVTQVDLAQGFNVHNIHWFSGSTALVAGTAQTYWVALFDKAGVLLGQSTSNNAKAIAASSVIQDALASTVTTTYTGPHYVGIMNAQTGGTMPTIGGYTSLATVTGTVSTDGLKFGGTADASLTTTAPTTLGAITGVATIPWVGIS